MRLWAPLLSELITTDTPWQVFEDAKCGFLEPGKFADMAILSVCPQNDPVGIWELTVEMTMVGAATIFQLH